MAMSSTLTSGAFESAEIATSVTDDAQAQLQFVQDIRSGRLNLLWKITLTSVLILIWAVVFFASSTNISFLTLLLPVVVIGGSSLLTRFLLQKNMFPFATWTYALGVLTAAGLLMIPENEDLRTVVPGIGILLIFVLGMLMSIQDTFILLGVSYLLLIGVPTAATGELPFTTGSVVLMAMMAVAALLVTQVSGELYGIAQWSMESYRKERDTANKLHQNRVELERSLLKQKNLTMQLESINSQLDEARQAAELAKQFRGQFLANMSHELRTPLNAIIGFSETMLNFPVMYEGIELPSEYRQDMARIYGSGKHLLNIINDILDLSKIDAGRLEIDMEPVDLEPIFKGLLSTAVGLIGTKPIELHSHLPAELPMVTGDPLRIRQVLINLYSNAAKFTDEGSITLSLTCDANVVTIGVTDTGPGITQDSVERIFEAFQQGDQGRRHKRAGSGLGLAISRQLLDLMNGEIWVESEVGAGSTFYIRLARYYPAGVDSEWMEVEEIG